MPGINARTTTISTVEQRLQQLADRDYAVKCTRFFKTGPGEYAEHDRFLGIRVPALRALTKELRANLTLEDCSTLLKNPWHEYRLFALLAMVDLFQRGDENFQHQIVRCYFSHKKHVNNWDLVDASAPKITGQWFYQRDRGQLHKLIRSKSLWQRRIPVVSTFYYIRKNDLDDTFDYAESLLHDPEDLIHKACGWMLREAGKRDEPRLIRFLHTHRGQIPRVMFSYATEKLSKTTRDQLKALS